MSTGKTGGGGETRGNGGGSEGTPVNIVNKALFRYTGLQYTLLLVDYDTFCEHSSTGDVDEECDMEGESRHLLSIHADLETTKINAIEHFLYVESFRDEQKICVNLVLRGQDVYAILPAGSG